MSDCKTLTLDSATWDLASGGEEEVPANYELKRWRKSINKGGSCQGT